MKASYLFTHFPAIINLHSVSVLLDNNEMIWTLSFSILDVILIVPANISIRWDNLSSGEEQLEVETEPLEQIMKVV